MPRSATRTAVLAVASLLNSACREGTLGEPSGVSTASPSASTSAPAAPARRPRHTPLSGERVEIPGGDFLAGSVPGENGRRPEVEPRRKKVTLGPFTIDKLPYPGEPGKPALTGVGRDRAERLCADRGARLCTELEWERACKGPRSDDFAGGATWDGRCGTSPESCASGFEILGMGALREWTASDVVPTVEGQLRRAAVRGAAHDAEAPLHRCAHRTGLDATLEAEDLGFRCCKGPPNAAVVTEPKLGQTYLRAKLPATRLEALLRASPITESLGKDVVYFRDPDAANTVIARGPGDKKGFSFTVAPLLWNPVAGADFLVVAARSGKDTSFVVVFRVIGEDEYALASSFVMKNEPGPVALAYDGYIRPRLHFTTCWGCPGETGKILYREPDSPIVLQP